jgi:hypothetical protein
MLYANFMSTAHSLETPLVLESLENFERRIQEISNTLQRCDGQISYFDQRLKNFSVADEVVGAVAEAGLAPVFSLSVSSFNEKMNSLESYTKVIEKVLSFAKNFLAVSAKTAYVVSIPAGVTTAVVAPEMTGKLLTKVEKVKVIALSDGNYELKLAAFEQLASSGNLDASTCDKNAAVCKAIEEIESNSNQANEEFEANSDQANDFDNKTASAEFTNTENAFAATGAAATPANAAAADTTTATTPNVVSVPTTTAATAAPNTAAPITTAAVTAAVTATPNAAASIATAAVAATPQAAAAIINAAVTAAPHAAASITSAAVAAIPNAAAAITNAAVSAGGDPGVVALAAITAGADPTLVNDSIAQATVDDVTTNVTTPDSTENSSQLSTIVAASVSPS